MGQGIFSHIVYFLLISFITSFILSVTVNSTMEKVIKKGFVYFFSLTGLVLVFSILVFIFTVI